MLGSIIGDIVGSQYEYQEFNDSLNGKIDIDRRKSIFCRTDLLNEDSFISDDTILTVAIADAIINNTSYEEKLREYGYKYYKTNRENYFKSAFSPGFIKWLNHEKMGDSIGNGSAMRVSPIAYLYNNLEKVEEEAKKSAIPTHNSIEGIKGAQAISSTIFMARKKMSKSDIAIYVSKKYGYNLSIDLDDLTKSNKFNGTCEVTVPQAISIFMQSDNFDESIRKAISIGGDCDTVACMVGGISEAYYGISQKLAAQALSYVPNEFKEVILKAYELEMNNKDINEDFIR